MVLTLQMTLKTLTCILFSFKGELRSLCQEYYKRICVMEDEKYDLEKEVECKDYQVGPITSKS